MGGGFLPILGLAVLFTLMMYFLMVRPIRQREKKHDSLVDDLERGDTVITAGGMYGEIERIHEDSVILKVESGAMVRVTKGGILKREDDTLDIQGLIG
ncbi:preprotein translocase subunit YajC [Chloroflexota bacterium]